MVKSVPTILSPHDHRPPAHHTPIGKAECIAIWRSRGRMAVPTSKGAIADVLIVRLFETTSVNGLPLDALVEAHVAINAPVKRFGVVFGDTPPSRLGPVQATACSVDIRGGGG